jgi:hypothetical protein
MMYDDQQSERLRQKLAAPAALTFEQAQAQIEALVAAELAGQDVDTTFAAVLQALDRYPALAERYYALMEEQTAFAAAEEPLAAPATTPTFFPDPGSEESAGKAGAETGQPPAE